jgi:hypothetical protein
MSINIIFVPFVLSATTPYIGHSLQIGSALYKYVVYVIPLCHKMFEILKFNFTFHFLPYMWNVG